MAEITDITREMKHACALRELRMRRSTYPRWVRAKKMRQSEADREIAVMKAIADDYAAPDLLGGVE
ncbi:hypothetical protein [Oceaniglobus ichthyenteri]|uniref:hypothetical protein n=1 Tax=Oceaniglobus ichthyenteri TaxID=2136177 RepID=UPI0013DDE1A0|nr:hypothetical protein [Oceaniglobus ichthyenteri]